MKTEPELTTLPTTREGIPIKSSIEGYVIIAQNIHEEATEEDIADFFQEFGDVKNIHLNLDRQSGYVKGYTLIEYKTLEDAKKAIEQGQSEELLGRELDIDFAFVQDQGLVDPIRKTEERKRDKSPERS